jgi:hypothetical protein
MDTESAFAFQRFGHPAEVSKVSVQVQQVPRILGNGFQADIKHATFTRILHN